MFVANDGRSVGHVVRALAVARALRARTPAEVLLVTTSLADGLLAWAGVPTVRVPPAGALPEPERRSLARAVVTAAAEGFRPDLLVVDTFPSGPHLEVEEALERVRRRVLVRRTVRPERAADPSAARGLGAYDRVLVPDDPGPQPLPDHPRCLRVPPIVLDVDAAPEDAARGRLRRPGRPSVLVSCGGRQDAASVELGRRVEAWCAARGAPPPLVVDGLLDSPERAVPTPLGRWLRAFDVVVASAGYNSAHECATLGIPAVLYARDRQYDDQAARAARFEAAGLAVALRDPAGVDDALDRALGLRPPPWPGDGAARSADALVEVVST